MESGTEWQEKESDVKLRLQQGQGAFSFISKVSESGKYHAGCHYKGLRISFSKPRIESMTKEFGVSVNGFSRKKSGFSMSCFEATPEYMLSMPV
jgi:hypothetical protein